MKPATGVLLGLTIGAIGSNVARPCPAWIIGLAIVILISRFMFAEEP